MENVHTHNSSLEGAMKLKFAPFCSSSAHWKACAIFLSLSLLRAAEAIEGMLSVIMKYVKDVIVSVRE